MLAPTTPMLKLRETSGTAHSRPLLVDPRRIQWSQCSSGKPGASSSHSSRRSIQPRPGKKSVRKRREASLGCTRLSKPLSFQLDTHHSVGSARSSHAVCAKKRTKSGEKTCAAWARHGRGMGAAWARHGCGMGAAWAWHGMGVCGMHESGREGPG